MSTDPLAGRPGLRTTRNNPLIKALHYIGESRKLHGAVLITFDGDRVGVNSWGSNPTWGKAMEHLADQALAKIDDGELGPPPGLLE